MKIKLVLLLSIFSCSILSGMMSRTQKDNFKPLLEDKFLYLQENLSQKEYRLFINTMSNQANTEHGIKINGAHHAFSQNRGSLLAILNQVDPQLHPMIKKEVRQTYFKLSIPKQ